MTGQRQPHEMVSSGLEVADRQAKLTIPCLNGLAENITRQDPTSTTGDNVHLLAANGQFGCYVDGSGPKPYHGNSLALERARSPVELAMHEPALVLLASRKIRNGRI